MKALVIPVCAAVGLAVFTAWALGSYAHPALGAVPPTYQPSPVPQQTSSPSGSTFHTFGHQLHLPQSPAAGKVSNALRQHPQAALQIIHAYRARR